MINLIDGLGQIGSCLHQYIHQEKYQTLDIDIYHTWNFRVKEENIQREEYEKLKRYVKNTNRSFLFISTAIVNYNPYYHYKLLSESYILNNTSNGYIIRLPNLIGKGIWEKLKNKSVEPYGTIETISIKEATEKIIEVIPKFNSNNRVMNILGTKIPATVICELLNFDV